VDEASPVPSSRPVFIAVIGLIDAVQLDAVKAAIHSLDPDAMVVGHIPQGLVEVRSRSGAEALCLAIEAAGYPAAETERRPRRPRPAGLGRLVGRSVLWGLAWAILLPILGFFAMLIAIQFDPACNAPGDSGGCYMGLATAPVLLSFPGALLGFAVTFGLGLRRLRRLQTLPF